MLEDVLGAWHPLETTNYICAACLTTFPIFVNRSGVHVCLRFEAIWPLNISPSSNCLPKSRIQFTPQGLWPLFYDWTHLSGSGRLNEKKFLNISANITVYVLRIYDTGRCVSFYINLVLGRICDATITFVDVKCICSNSTVDAFCIFGKYKLNFRTLCKSTFYIKHWMQKIKHRLLVGAGKVSVASCLPNVRQVIFECVKYFA